VVTYGDTAHDGVTDVRLVKLSRDGSQRAHYARVNDFVL
jgi:hypothetical protein